MKVIDTDRQSPFLNKNRLFLFLVVIATISLTALYFFWYWISPVSDAFETGRFLFTIYLFIVLFWIFIRGKISIFANLLVFLFFVISILYYKNFLSSILDRVEYAGVQYYITYSQEPFDGWQDYHITARKGLFQYNSHGLGMVSVGDDLKLKYDTTINKMTVVETEGLAGGEIIFSIEEENPLFYEAVEELDNYVYYLFSSCRQIGVDCQNRIYFLYKCELDNTYCKQLPFMYDGKFGGYSSKLIKHEAASEMEIYFEPYFDREQKEVLIYSYGREPRCYVEDCYISKMP